MTAVPLIDLTPWYAGDADDRRQVATQVDAALCEVGFLLLTGHPVTPQLTERVRREVRPFFGLPAPAKAELACLPGGRGWIPPGSEANAGADGLDTPPDLVETFRFGPEVTPPAVVGTSEEAWFGPNVWPEEVPGLRAAASAFADCCAGVAEDLLQVFALALDLPGNFFLTRCRGNTWSVNLNWYPARELVAPVEPGQFRIGQHTDVGTLTLLDRQPASGGLQVRTAEGEWVDAPFVPGALTVNAGDLLARWTGDRWRSTPHRVLPPPADVPTEELLSLVFFHEADPLTVVETLPTAAAGPERYEPVTAGQFLRSRMDSITVG
ncbi:MAG: oxidoreductase [Modestobacter sp.]|nr:oxidoreductase [Modestobacter sp.]